ncbi:MAG: very short patch repair endonuclease [Dongiaceae bacterium]
MILHQKRPTRHVVDATRSYIMSRVGQRNTPPEIRVRKILHGAGYRFRIHRKDIPGTPDIVLPRYKLLIFVHGCFWHRHKGCKKATFPKTRQQFWRKKFAANISRDAATVRLVRDLGWRCTIIWECQTLDSEALKRRIKRLLPVK